MQQKYSRGTSKCILIVLTLASKTGSYGGPFDTAREQAHIATTIGFNVRLMAGHLANDAPEAQTATNYREHFELVHRMPFTQGFTGLISCKMAMTMWRAVGNARVVHVSFSRELIPTLAALMAIVRRKKLVLQPHGMLTSRSSGIHKVVDIVTKRIYQKADNVVALTSVEAGELRQWAPKYSNSLIIQGNPIPEHERGQVRTLSCNPKIAFIARLHPRKNVRILLEAVKNLNAESVNPQLLLAGPDEGDLQHVKVALKNMNNVQYLGAVAADQVIEILDDTDIFVLPSHKEPWGNVLTLAMSMGLPVIVTDSAALAPLVDKNKAGIVVRDHDPQSLTSALETLCGDPTVYQTYSKNALELTRTKMGRASQINSLTKLYFIPNS